MILIKREKGFEGNFPSFAGWSAAVSYLEQNTGNFDSNEIIALINFETQEVKFYKMQLTVMVVSL